MKIRIHNKGSKPYKIRYKKGEEQTPAFIQPFSRGTFEKDVLDVKYLEIGQSQGVIEFSEVSGKPEKVTKKKGR